MNYLDPSDIEKIKHLAGRGQGFVSRGAPNGMDFGRVSSRNPDSEFAEHRSHNPGEGARFIDWKVYARKEKLYVKDFLQERSSGWEVFFDASASMGFPEGSRRLFVRSALYACGILLCRGEKINLHLVGEKKTVSRAGLRGFEKITSLDALFSSSRFSGGNFSVSEFLEKTSAARKDSGTLLFSDLLFPPDKLQDMASAMSSVPGKKHVVHFFEEDLRKLVTSGGEVVLSDSETGEELQFEYSAFRKILDEKRRKWAEECRLLFSKAGSRYLRVRGEEDLLVLREIVPGRKR